MLRIQLLHPVILQSLAAAGHGSQVLIADANYPHSTGVSAGATLVHLNLSPGICGAADVLAAVRSVVSFEAATMMRPEDPSDRPPIEQEYRRQLPELEVAFLNRSEFYRAAQQPAVALAIATGELQLYANLLLTIGSIRPGSAPA